MRDIRIIIDEEGNYDLDINIMAGGPEYLEKDSESVGQRAALAAYTSLGTIPGRLTDGVSWGNLLKQEISYTDISNQIGMQIQNYVGTTDDMHSYIPLIIPTSGRMSTVIMRV